MVKNSQVSRSGMKAPCMSKEQYKGIHDGVNDQGFAMHYRVSGPAWKPPEGEVASLPNILCIIIIIILLLLLLLLLLYYHIIIIIILLLLLLLLLYYHYYYYYYYSNMVSQLEVFDVRESIQQSKRMDSLLFLCWVF